MSPKIVTVGVDYHVIALADHAHHVYEYLLGYGVPCAPPERRGAICRTFRLEKRANLRQVRKLLDRWVVSEESPTT
jgi:hypothetical protein